MLNYSFLKRLSDLILALIFLTFLIPIFLLIAVLIKISSKGKIIFVQKRVGKNNKLFSCYKFRTMHQNSELILRKILLKSPEINHEFKSFQKITKDPRITHIGKFLRFTNKIDYKKRVALDIFYSRNINFYMDIGIFLKTIYVLFLPFGKGAY